MRQGELTDIVNNNLIMNLRSKGFEPLKLMCKIRILPLN